MEAHIHFDSETAASVNTSRRALTKMKWFKHVSHPLGTVRFYKIGAKYFWAVVPLNRHSNVKHSMNNTKISCKDHPELEFETPHEYVVHFNEHHPDAIALSRRTPAVSTFCGFDIPDPMFSYIERALVRPPNPTDDEFHDEVPI